MKTEEGKVKDGVKSFLTARGAYFFMPVQTGYGDKTLDILFCLQGRFGAIETKAPGKVPTPLQYTYMKRIETAGGWTCWGSDAVTINAAIAREFPL